MEFKDRIKQLREEKGLDLTKLAAQFDMKEAGVRAWELGRTKPGADTLIKLSQYFGCTTDYLLGLSEIKSRSDDEKDSEIRRLSETVKIQEGYIKQLKESAEKSIALAKEAADGLAVYKEGANKVAEILKPKGDDNGQT